MPEQTTTTIAPPSPAASTPPSAETKSPTTTPATTAPVVDKPSTPAPTKSKSFDDEIDAMAGKTDKAAVKKVEPAKQDAPKGDETKTPEVAPKAGEKPTDKPPVKGSMAEFRAAHDKLKSDHAALQQEVAKLRSAKPPEDTDKPRLVETIKAKDAEIAKLQEIVKFSKYEMSDEFQNQYQKPYLETASSAESRAVQLKVAGEDGSSRNLSKKEFWDIVGIGDENDALEAAEKLFGQGSAKANALIERRNEVLSAWRRAEKAKADFQATVKERTAKETEQETLTRTQQEAQQREAAETFQKLISERIESKPEYNKPDEGDEAGEKLVNSWTAVADLAFARLTPEKVALLPEGIRSKLVDGQLPASERVKLHASMYSALPERALAIHKLSLANEKIKELQSALAAYEETAPENAGDNGKPKQSGMVSIADEIDQMASAATR